jgi:AraC family transcriptional regulator
MQVERIQQHPTHALSLPARSRSGHAPVHPVHVPQSQSRALADRGNAVELDQEATGGGARWSAVARMGSLRAGGCGFSVWFQLRGTTRVQAREGSFVLGPGEWMALERDSAPELVAGRHGATLGILLPADPGGGRRADLLPGRGRMSRRDLRIAIRLWRNGREAGAARGPGDDAPARALASMLLHVASLQRELDGGISRCPGRSVRRKRQVFGRLQRARLFLDGHRDRVVRLTELAELTSFSSWYLSKTFHEIYDESPQAASVRLRLERACELLAATEYAISEIGAACGFDNSCSFARAFRARYRTTATAYRSDLRRGDMLKRGAKIGIDTKPATQSATAARTVMWSGI